MWMSGYIMFVVEKVKVHSAGENRRYAGTPDRLPMNSQTHGGVRGCMRAPCVTAREGTFTAGLFLGYKTCIALPVCRRSSQSALYGLALDFSMTMGELAIK